MENPKAKIGTPLRHPSGGAGATRSEDVHKDHSANQDPGAHQDHGAHQVHQVQAPGQAAEQSSSQGEGRAEPASHAQAADSDAASSESGNPDSVDKIRDIIFGVQMRDYDGRFRKLEDRLVKEAGVLRDDTARRFDTLERLLKQHVDSLGERVMAEQSSRTQAVQDLSQAIAALMEHVDRRTAEMDAQSQRAQQELWQELRTQTQTLTDEIRDRFDAVSAALDRQTTALRDEKTDRGWLASMLAEMAQRLQAGNAGA